MNNLINVTGCKTFTAQEVESFIGQVLTHNYELLKTHLCDPDLAPSIEGFAEQSGLLFLQINGEMISVESKIPEVEWYYDQFDTISKFMEPIYAKYRDKVQELTDQCHQMEFSYNEKTTKVEDFPLCAEFCRDSINVFKDMWKHFMVIGETKNLIAAYEHRVIENGMYQNRVTMYFECNVIYPIISYASGCADGSSMNFWLLLAILSKAERDEFVNSYRAIP